MRIHNKQFVIAPKPIKVHDDWVLEAISPSFYLSYCPSATVIKAQDLDNTTWFIIGVVTTYGTELEPPAISLSKLHTADVEEATSRWAGRWCLISANMILMDATNLIGLVYTKDQTIIASSVALLNELLTGERSLPRHPLKSNYYHNWYLLPLTGYTGIRKLLPQQKLTLSENTGANWILTARRFSIDRSELSYEDLYNELKNSLENEIKFLATKKKLNLHIALSGGYDSRLILALAMSSGCQFECYTHTIASMKVSDYTIPPLLCSRHRYIKGSKEQPERLRLFDQQNGMHALDNDRLLFSFGQWDEFKAEDVCLRGGILELAGHSQAHLYDRVENRSFEDIDARLFNYALKDYRPFQIDSMIEFFRFQRQEPLTGFDFNKIYYLNQRIAGWLSYIETGLDLLPSKSYNLGNSIYQINLMNSLPENVKKYKGFHIDYIYRNQPELLNYPFNSASAREKISGFINKTFNKLIFK